MDQIEMFPEIAAAGLSAADARQVGGEHYTRQPIQPWAAMEAWLTPEEFMGYLRGNCIKYHARFREKAGMQDLEKALHYTQKLQEFLRKHPELARK